MSPHDRAALVLAEAWRLLPPLKHAAPLVDIVLEDLGAVHGTYTPTTGVLRLSAQLFTADPLGTRRLIDLHGADPARVAPFCARDTHTALHELSHAIGAATGLDTTPAWLAVSGWVLSDEDLVGTARYWEHRPGWEPGPSPWRYQAGTWFGRAYASKSPEEDFADGVAALCLGWDRAYGAVAQPKLTWLRRQLWEEHGPRAVQAAARRWRRMFQAKREADLAPTERERRARRRTEAALLLAVSGLLLEWEQLWSQAGMPPGLHEVTQAALATQLMTALTPPAATWWATLAGTPSPVPGTALVPAVVRFVRTTLRQLESRVLPVLGQGPLAVREALRAVMADAVNVRAPMLVESVTRHMEQQAARAAAVQGGATHATWRTTSGNPCAWCADLEGQTFVLSSAPLWSQGDTLMTDTGKQMLLDYEDIYHPPIHISCQCVLDYF